MFNFDEANKMTRETMDGMLKSYSEVAKGFQSIAVESGEYSRKSLKDMTSFVEELSAARSIETAYELQTGYMKSSYEGLVAEATRMTGIYSDLAKTIYKPYGLPMTGSTGTVAANVA